MPDLSTRLLPLTVANADDGTSLATVGGENNRKPVKTLLDWREEITRERRAENTIYRARKISAEHGFFYRKMANGDVSVCPTKDTDS